MTDDRIAGLPDSGTIEPGDPGHIEVHDRMAELMQFAAERIGIILDPPAPKPAVIGEYGHVDAHNTLLANIEQIAAEAGTAVGGPPAPVLTNPEGGSVVAFTSGGEGAGGPTIAYGAEIEPNDHGETVTVDVTDPAVGGEVAVSGTQPFTNYIVFVYGVNVAGRGESAATDAFQLNYNEATGGTETIEDNYNNTGQKWKVHTFTAGDGTLNVLQSSGAFPFRVVVGGGGGSAGGPAPDYYTGGGAGGAGQGVETQFDSLPVSNPMTIAVGAGGPGGGGAGVHGQNGKPSTFNGVTATGGGGGRHGNNNPGPGGAAGSPNGPTVTSNISGRDATYGGLGGGGNGGKGADGTVIVAYQIGTSTTREIAQAQAEAAAREAGYATGYDVGVTDGREQRDTEIRAAAEQVKEALPTKDKK